MTEREAERAALATWNAAVAAREATDAACYDATLQYDSPAFRSLLKLRSMTDRAVYLNPMFKSSVLSVASGF